MYYVYILANQPLPEKSRSNPGPGNEKTPWSTAGIPDGLICTPHYRAVIASQCAHWRGNPSLSISIII